MIKRAKSDDSSAAELGSPEDEGLLGRRPSSYCPRYEKGACCLVSDRTLVRYGVDRGIAVLTLADPARGNPLSLALATQLAEALERASEDPDAQVLLLQAEGRNFCVGGDVFEMSAAEDRGEHMAGLTESAHRAVRALFDCGKPVVAALQGAVAGGAIGLALATDFAVADESTRFVFAYPAIGASPDCGTSWLLPRSLGLGRALRFALVEGTIGAADAVESGLAGELTATGTAQIRAHEIALGLVSGAPRALGEARRLMRQSWVSGFPEHLERERLAMIAAVQDARSVDLMDAFVERAERRRS